jgi:hypothetical protein
MNKTTPESWIFTPRPPKGGPIIRDNYQNMEKFGIKTICSRIMGMQKDTEKVILEIQSIVKELLKVPLGGFRGKTRRI